MPNQTDLPPLETVIQFTDNPLAELVRGLVIKILFPITEVEGVNVIEPRLVVINDADLYKKSLQEARTDRNIDDTMTYALSTGFGAIEFGVTWINPL